MLSLLFFCAILGVSGNMALRAAMSAHPLTHANPVAVWLNALHTPWTYIGLVFYIASMLLWLYLLARLELKYAYPLFVSFSFLLITLGAPALLREKLCFTQVVGSLIILCGIWIVSLH